MKSVTKLGRASHASSAPSLPLPMDAASAASVESLKRKYRDTLEDHAQQLQSIADTQVRGMRIGAWDDEGGRGRGGNRSSRGS